MAVAIFSSPTETCSETSEFSQLIRADSNSRSNASGKALRSYGDEAFTRQESKASNARFSPLSSHIFTVASCKSFMGEIPV